MPFRRRRMSLMQRTSNPVKHSDTLQASHGAASVPTEVEILTTDVGARTLTGATQTIQANATTDNDVMVGCQVKYVNIRIQSCTRPDQASGNVSIGWLEYAFVCVKESETSVPNNNIGVSTLGDICTKMYRNECIWTGAIPISGSVPNVQDMHFKIPRLKTKIKVGDHWRLYFYYRDSSAVEGGTDTCRTIVTTNFISYD